MEGRCLFSLFRHISPPPGTPILGCGGSFKGGGGRMEMDKWETGVEEESRNCLAAPVIPPDPSLNFLTS